MIAITALVLPLAGCYTQLKTNPRPEVVDSGSEELPPGHPPIPPDQGNLPPGHRPTGPPGPGSANGAPVIGPSYEPNIDRNTARNLWRDQGISTYSYRLRNETQGVREEYTVDVERSNVVNVRDYYGNGYPPHPADALTINHWFDALWNEGGYGASYDGADGHPLRFEFRRPGSSVGSVHTILWLERY
ncbi:MAG TPA: DUF6174 domain-containing protein [Candidatus Eisenbacteria bacterium]